MGLWWMEKAIISFLPVVRIRVFSVWTELQTKANTPLAITKKDAEGMIVVSVFNYFPSVK